MIAKYVLYILKLPDLRFMDFEVSFCKELTFENFESGLSFLKLLQTFLACRLASIDEQSQRATSGTTHWKGEESKKSLPKGQVDLAN